MKDSMKYEPLLHLVLFQPEIPQNTGNVGRTCVAIGAKLWLVRPLGFQLDAKHLRRAGLDYWEHLEWVRQRNGERIPLDLQAFLVCHQCVLRRNACTRTVRKNKWLAVFGYILVCCVFIHHNRCPCRVPLCHCRCDLNNGKKTGDCLFKTGK